MHLSEESEHLKKMQQGDYDAFSAVFNHFYPSLVFFARKMVTPEPAAEDIVTEIFLKLWQKHAGFSTLQSVKAFLYISTRNACINYMEHAKYQNKVKDKLSYLLNENEGTILQEITRTEVLRDLFHTVQHLPQQCRKIILMSYIEGLSNREIADKLCLSVHTVRNQKVRGIQLIRRKINSIFCVLP